MSTETAACPQKIHRAPCRCGLPSEVEEERIDDILSTTADEWARVMRRAPRIAAARLGRPLTPEESVDLAERIRSAVARG